VHRKIESDRKIESGALLFISRIEREWSNNGRIRMIDNNYINYR